MRGWAKVLGVSGIVCGACTSAMALSATKLWSTNFGSGGCENAVISPDLKTIAIGVKSGANAEIRIVDIANPQTIYKKLYLAQNCTGDKCNEVECMAWSGDGRYLAAGGNGTGLKIWEVATSKEVWKRSGGEHDGMTSDPKGSVFFMGSGGGVTVVEVPSLKIGTATGTMGCGINSIDFAHDGKTMVVGSCGGSKYAGGYISVWNVSSTVATMTKKVRTPGSVKTTRITPDGQYLITAEGGCGYVRVRNRNLDVLKSVATPGRYSTEYEAYGPACDGGGSYVDHAELSPDGKYWATQATTSTLKFYTMPDCRNVLTVSSVNNGEYMCWRGDRLLIASSSGNLIMFRMDFGNSGGSTRSVLHPLPGASEQAAGGVQHFSLLGTRVNPLATRSSGSTMLVLGRGRDGERLLVRTILARP